MSPSTIADISGRLASTNFPHLLIFFCFLLTFAEQVPKFRLLEVITLECTT
jgi:hypothetical protein